MNRTLPLVILALLLLAAVPSAQAAWTSSATVPAAFRPERTVSFTYSVQSSSSLDAPLQWHVRLTTCQDLNADTYCESSEPEFVDHGEQSISRLAGQSGSLSWSVRLDQPEGTYRYDFHTRCNNNPCTTEPGAGPHNKTDTFALRYTDTWTRSIIATSPVRAGDSQTVQYELKSTSVDDRDLTGTAQLYSTPDGEAERDMGAQSFSVNANQQVTLAWPGTDFPNIGIQQLRTTDTTGSDTTLDVAVRGVHLHVVQPRETYTAGNAFGLYFTLEGHGDMPGPHPLDNRQISLSVYNGTFLVAREISTTDSNGQAYLSFQTAEDHTTLTWNASGTISWLGDEYDIDVNGTVLVLTAAIADDVSAIRDDLEDLQLKGVHLDELGSRHVFLTSVRAVGAVALVITLVLLVIYVAIRV